MYTRVANSNPMNNGGPSHLHGNHKQWPNYRNNNNTLYDIAAQKSMYNVTMVRSLLKHGSNLLQVFKFLLYIMVTNIS